MAKQSQVTVAITVHVSEDDAARVDALAASLGVSRSAASRLLLRRAISRIGKEPLEAVRGRR